VHRSRMADFGGHEYRCGRRPVEWQMRWRVRNGGQCDLRWRDDSTIGEWLRRN
jgi:hypothetical protein